LKGVLRKMDEKLVFGGICFLSGIACGILIDKGIKGLSHKKFSFTYEGDVDEDDPVLSMDTAEVNRRIKADPVKMQIAKSMFTYFMTNLETECNFLGISSKGLNDEEFQSQAIQLVKMLVLEESLKPIAFAYKEDIKKSIKKEIDDNTRYFVEVHYIGFMEKNKYEL